MTLLRRAVALAIIALLAFAFGALLAACGPAGGSPNCPPGQWWVDKPGSGWECAPGVLGWTPPASFGSSQ